MKYDWSNRDQKSNEKFVRMKESWLLGLERLIDGRVGRWKLLADHYFPLLEDLRERNTAMTACLRALPELEVANRP